MPRPKGHRSEQSQEDSKPPPAPPAPNFKQHCEAFVKSMLDNAPAVGAAITDIRPLMGWSEAVGALLNHHDLVPLDPDHSARDAFMNVSGAIGALFEDSHEDASSRSLSMQKVVQTMRRHLRHDPAPKSFIKAAELGNKTLDLTRDSHVKLLANTADFNVAKDRHRTPLRLIQHFVEGGPISTAELKKRVVLLYGPSGSGKTMGAFLTAYLHNGVSALLRPDTTVEDVKAPLNETKIQRLLDEDAAGDAPRGTLKRKQPARSAPKRKRVTTTRDTRVRDYIVKRVAALVPEDFRQPPSDPTRPLVVVLDEFGNHPQLVRGVISARQSIVDQLEEQVTGGNPVHIIVSGTGLEGVAHSPGTEASQYVLRRVRPLVWEHVKDDQDVVPVSVRKAMADESCPETQLARQIVGNARACTLFVRAFETALLHMASRQTMDWPNVDAMWMDVRLVRTAAAMAAVEFKELNGLAKLSRQEHLGVMLDAVALQSVMTPTTPADQIRVAQCVHECGVSVDRAVVKPPRARSVSTQDLTFVDGVNSVTLYVPVAAEGVRYEVEPAQLAILLLLHGLGDRGTSPDSFEENTMDFLVWAVNASRKRFAPATPDGVYFQRSSETEKRTSRAWRYPRGVDTAMGLGAHSRWRYPLELIDVLRDMRAAVEKEDALLHVLYYRAATDFRTKADLETIVQARGVPEDADVAHVVLNKERAPAQDISVYMHGAVLHVQCKRFASSAISELDVYRELHKMGNEDWRCALASVVGMKHGELLEARARGSTAQRTLAELVEQGKLSGSFVNSIKQAREFAASKGKSKLHNAARKIVRASRCDQRMPRYALILYVGGQPVPQRALSEELPADATVYACCRGDAETASSDKIEAAAARLRGLYPLAVGQPSRVNGLAAGGAGVDEEKTR